MSAEQIEDIYPLLPTQHGMLFHGLCAPGSGVYHVQICYILQGYVDTSVFERSWQEIVKRHSILRTAFFMTDLDQPVQVVKSQATVPLERSDWRGLSPAEQKDRLEAFLQADRRRGFDISQAPLMRLALFRLAEDRYHFVWSFHHALLDGWSKSIVLREVVDCYEALRRSEPLSWKEAPRFRDYIAWLQKQHENPQAEEFWRAFLKGFTTPTPVAADVSREAAGATTEPYGEVECKLSRETTEKLQAFARRNQLTLNTVIQGAWAILLSRYSGESDVVFGNVVSVRPHTLPGFDLMVGPFINTVPTRVRVLPADSPLTLLKNLQYEQTELRPYDYSSLLQVQQWSEIPRGMPLFESIVVFENYPEDSVRSENADMEIWRDGSYQRTNYPITVVAVPGMELSLGIMFDAARFDTRAVTRTLGHLRVLLEAIVADSDQPLSTLPLLTDAERQQLLVEWNNIRLEYPRDKCIHELFELQVERTPDAVAVVSGDRRLTYRELNRRANRLARYLQGLGVGPEVLVGICSERSLEMVVGLLAVLKAGGAYVPLDPAYPRERLAFILEDTQVPVLLTQRSLGETLPESPAKLVFLDADCPAIARAGEENPASHATPCNLAYIIYTSGSTGRPKGVAIAHHSAVVLLHWARDLFGMNGVAAVLASTSICFDLSVFELFVPLSWGGKVVLAQNLLQLPTLPAAEEVTLINTVPSAMSELLRMEAIPASVRIVNLAGEPLQNGLVKQIYEHRTIKQVFDLYGPSEDTTYSTFAARTGAGPATIGRPIAGTQIYLLDTHLNPVPVGIGGELYIGGDGLARGYLSRPELTAEKFIPNPFGGQPGSRLYRTGDLVSYWPDGNIKFLGRVDNQVKVRGFRIELGEIESVVAQHPGIQDGVVLAREDDPGDRRLVAYIVPRPEQFPTVTELRSFLKNKLPEYMVPSVWLVLDALPLTPNGKVNRKALPAPDRTRPELDGVFVAPKNEVEKTIAGIWRDVLRLEKVGVHDSFFDLGGHSLLLIQVHSRLVQAFKRDLALVQMFEYPTVSSLAGYLNQHQSEPASRVEHDIRAENTKDGKARLARQRRQRQEYLEQD